MKTGRMKAFLLGIALLVCNAAAADDTLLDYVLDACEADLQQYCSQVTLGDGRLLACFFAHEDKLSGKCQYALYQASAQLEQAVNALIYLATECEQDIVTHCAAGADPSTCPPNRHRAPITNSGTRAPTSLNSAERHVVR